jgi:hypothetical protein
MPSLDYLNKRAAQRKQFVFLLPYIIAFFSLLLVGQIIIQFTTVNQFKKESGRILDLQTKITGYRRQKSVLGSTYKPMYSLVIGLDDLNSYNVENEADRKMLGGILHKGDSVTIYSPTTLIKVLSTGFFHPVSQIEQNGHVVYSFDEVKKENYVIIGLYTGFILLLFFTWRFQKKYAI